MGFLYERLGNYEEAFQYNLRALGIFRKIGKRDFEIGTLTNLASVRYGQGNYHEARAYASRAIQLGEDLGGNRMEVPARVLLGHIHLALKEFDDAERVFNIALDICEQTGYRRVMADLWNGLARLSLERQDQGRALKAVEQILRLVETDPSLASVSDEPMRSFSTCYLVLQHYDDPRAAEVLKKAYAQLETYAAKLTDVQLRQMFMGQVQANREIVSLWHRYDLKNTDSVRVE